MKFKVKKLFILVDHRQKKKLCRRFRTKMKRKNSEREFKLNKT